MVLLTIILLFFGFIFYMPYSSRPVEVRPDRVYEYEERIKEENQNEKEETINQDPLEEELPEELPQEYDHIKPIKPMNIYTISSYPIILVLTGTTCPHCHNYKPVLEEVLAENNLMAYEIDMWALTDKEKKEITDLVGQVDGVPTTIILNQNEVVDKKIGGIPKTELIELLKTNGFIN